MERRRNRNSMRNSLIIFMTAALSVVGSACRRSGGQEAERWPKRLAVPEEKVAVSDGITVSLGGFGSSMAYRASDSTFWLLTDRGPNVDGKDAVSKVFVLPDYAPCVGVFKWKGDTLEKIRQITLKDEMGNDFCGLPNVKGDGVTGEIAYNLKGDEISSGRRGLDPEGLALMPDGTFWVSDEYGPFVIHFDAEGNWLEELSPFNGGLPTRYANRRPNRGMEGLAATKEGGKLFGIMQAPLMGESDGGRGLYLPLWEYSLADSVTREYAYPLDNEENGVSELCCLNDTTLLVLERDGRFPGKGVKAAKLIYRVTLPKAPEDAWPILKKTLEIDILQAIPDYPHDKAEGICLLNDSIVGVVNDDDFGVNSPTSPDGSVVPKLDACGQLDRNEICLIKRR